MAEHRIHFPFGEPPGRGEVVEIAPGMLWARLPLPFRLDHVNLYFLEDNGGWAVIDSGARHRLCIEGWEALLRGPLAGALLSRVVVTHYHPDHVGLAGWLAERHGAEVLTTETCRDLTRRLLVEQESKAAWVDFYIRGGMDPDLAGRTGFHTAGFDDYTTPLPAEVTVVGDGDTLSIGGRDLRAIFADGHATNQLTLHCPDAGVYFAADQVIARITPHVGIKPSDIEADPLGAFLSAVRRLGRELPADVLAAPGHELPFCGLTARCEALVRHHAVRCRAILDACARDPRSVTGLLPVLFSRELDGEVISFAHGEARAHLNFLSAHGLLRRSDDATGVDIWERVGSLDDFDAILGAL